MLMSPQWLGMHEKSARKPKELRTKCEIDEECATLLIENRTKTATI